MSLHALTRFGLLAAAAGLLGACDGDRAAPLAPEARHQMATAASPQAELVTTLTRRQPLPVDLTMAALIGRQGGSFTIPGTGLRVVVPPRAVSGWTLFTATALKGDLVAYEFGPHGLRFNVPLYLTQDLRGTTWDTLESWAVMEGGYFKSRSQLDDATDQAYVDEFLPVVVDATTATLHFAVKHFSGYMVSSGRVLSILR